MLRLSRGFSFSCCCGLPVGVWTFWLVVLGSSHALWTSQWIVSTAAALAIDNKVALFLPLYYYHQYHDSRKKCYSNTTNHQYHAWNPTRRPLLLFLPAPCWLQPLHPIDPHSLSIAVANPHGLNHKAHMFVDDLRRFVDGVEWTYFFCFAPQALGKESNLTNIFQRGVET